MRRLVFSLILVCCSVGVVPTHESFSRDAPPDSLSAASTEAGSPNLSLARDYLHGMEGGSLDRLDHLFLPGGLSMVLENTSQEGSWEHYKEHHLQPEMKESSDFKFTVEKESEKNFGSTAVVHQVGLFTVKVGEETKKYRSAVTYVIVDHSGERRIAHLHWASRAAKN